MSMKLSTAIRRGAEIRGQTHGEFFQRGRSCALGAAFEANLGHRDLGKGPTLVKQFPELGIVIDYSHSWGRTLLRAVIGLNDRARWSREEIADWVDTVLP